MVLKQLVVQLLEELQKKPTGFVGGREFNTILLQTKEPKERIVTKAGEQDEKQMAPPPSETPPGRQQIRIDDSKAIPLYANFCRVTGTPEELIVDFGLNPQPTGMPTEPIAITQRIVTNYYTAKRMLHALQLTVQRHEATFGALELDVQRRVQPSAMRPN